MATGGGVWPAAGVKAGQRITAQVTALSAEGDGLGEVDGRQVVLRRCLPGDRVEATVRRRRGGRTEADVERILAARVPRVAAPCVHYGTCGGCAWQDVGYEEQLRTKGEMARRTLGDQGLVLPSVPEVWGSPRVFQYRNKMEFSFATGRDGGLELGLHLRGRYNRVFDLQACHLQSEVSNQVVAATRRAAAGTGLSAYDLKRHEGALRFLVVRDAKGTGQLMVDLVVSAYPDPAVDEMCSRLLGDVPGIDTLVVTVQATKGQTAVGQTERVVKGAGTIVEVCDGIQYEISARSFFQSNPLQAERLFRLTCQAAGTSAHGEVLDLYCGSGGIALQLARRARRVTGIESVPQAVADAQRNAARNGIANCTFRAGLVEDVLGAWSGSVPDLVVVDPPRPGVHPRALRALRGMAPAHLVYVSCNPSTMARDLVPLVADGYTIDQLHLVDMFPHTAHCEAVAGLRRGPAPGAGSA
ncbi:MAG: 23S rRNA (uracil(1939)-C(5))-methyltransferase RlmD [Candidatus Latescibacterota bacterium]